MIIIIIRIIIMFLDVTGITPQPQGSMHTLNEILVAAISVKGHWEYSSTAGADQRQTEFFPKSLY